MKMTYNDNAIDDIVQYAQQFVDKNLSDVLTYKHIDRVSEKVSSYGNKRKGHFGDLVEEHIFGIQNNSIAAPDFPKVGIELKTTPLKRHATKKYVAKERLVFSMINYIDIINETWETSSFLKKNKLLLLMFYLYESDIDLLQYKFKLVHLLDLLSDISAADIAQIQKDWETIVSKIKSGEAHLLSEGDTAYLGAATKASKATDRRKQPNSTEGAKPRAFSLKPTYLNFIIQKYLGNEDKTSTSLLNDKSLPLTIEENILSRFSSYIGKTNLQIEKDLGITYSIRPKSHRRHLVNKILGTNSNKIEELEKANITLRVIALEKSGKLKEAISFPTFKYEEIVQQTWEDSKFFEELSTKRFLFVVFRKIDNDKTVLEKFKFWNFPMKDIKKAQWVWDETINRINDQRAHQLPGMKENSVAHVRPHAKNKDDTYPTGYGTEEVKKCFWLNAKYIETQLKG